MDLATLRAAMQQTFVDDATLTSYLPHFNEAMRAADITTARRAAGWCSQVGHESAGLRYMAEIATSDPSWNWDRTRYRGRGPIQLTWQGNYRKFGIWCKAQGYIDDSELFVNQPELVEQPRWGFLAASWYWLNAGPRPGQINSFADAGDILAVSRCVNGWVEGQEPHGYADRVARWNQCLEIGDALLTDSTPIPTPAPTGGAVSLTDPFTGAMWSPNRYHPRNGGTPRWIAVHTQEGGRTAVDLAKFLDDPNSQVSYHAVNDELAALKVVAEDDAPWSASNANPFAFHICLAGSYSAWSRGKWLETDASDGKNEDAELTLAAKIIAWWCQKYSIPAEYIGGNGIPWGRDGICGHMDFGVWGGGHHDPGPNFPWDELIRRVQAFLAGAAPAPLPAPTPVGPGGGQPVDPNTSQYFTGLLYQGSEGPQVSELQRVLGGGLPVDGDFGPLTDAAVRAFQRSAGLVVDGIVGPQTAAALKLRRVA